MSLLNPKCDHEKKGHRLAGVHVDYANRQQVAELSGSDVEGYAAGDWKLSKERVQTMMADNLEACRSAGHEEECACGHEVFNHPASGVCEGHRTD